MRYSQISVEKVFACSIAFIISLYFVFHEEKPNKDHCCVEVFLGEEVEPPKKEVKKLSIKKVRKKIKINQREVYCLAKNIYHEAKFEEYLGKISVAQVTYNRLKSGKWGDTFCKVVYNPKQFSWTNQKSLLKESPSGPRWHSAKKVAENFLNGSRVENLENSYHYHADYINPPKWTRKMVIITKIGHHIFYKDIK